MLPELPENEAQGEIARIYREIRDTTGVPYVSSLQRHLATRPGWLEWSWSVVGPGFRRGDIPAAVWQAAAALRVPILPKVSRAALRSLGVDGQGESAIRNVLDSFIRVSPTNLGFSGVVRRILLDSVEVEKTPIDAPRMPLPVLSPLPPLVDIAALAPREREVVMSMAITVDGQPFVPGLYRMLARWPAWFAHAVTVLVSTRDDAEMACAQLASRIDDIVPALMHGLPLSTPPLTDRETDSEDERARIIAAIDRYRETSPQMVVYCRMLKSSLPDPVNL